MKCFILTFDDKVFEAVLKVAASYGVGLSELIRNTLAAEGQSRNRKEEAEVIRQTRDGVQVEEFDRDDWVPKPVDPVAVKPTIAEPIAPPAAVSAQVDPLAPIELVKRDGVTPEAAVNAGLAAVGLPPVPASPESAPVAPFPAFVTPEQTPIAPTPVTPPVAAPAAPVAEMAPAVQAAAEMPPAAPAVAPSVTPASPPPVS